MKKQISRTFAAAALICISVGSILAQSRSVKTIYVADPTTSSSIPQDDQKLNKRLADAAVVFAEVRLNSSKDLNVKRSNSPCGPDSVQTAAQSLPAETNADSYEVTIAIRTLGISGLDPNEKELELVLDFDLVKYAKCKRTTLVHRSLPISEKNAFDAFLQMGDVLEVRLRNELAAPKINVDVSDISAETDSLRAIRDDLMTRLFARLASETDFRVRDIRGAKPSEDADYIITGVLIKDKKGVRFTIRNVKDSSKTQSPFVPGPTDQKNIEALDSFMSKAAEEVVNYIRVCPSTALTDAEVGNAISQATELLCKNNPVCAKPSEVILLLMRLSCAGKQTAASLKLLGDAYVLTEDFAKAADAYHQSWNKLDTDRTDEIVSIISLEGDAWYRAENYGNAAQSYELAITKSPDLQPAREGVYLQRARSYRFSADHQRALAAVLDGLNKYPTSNELEAELALAVSKIPPAQIQANYDLLLKNKNLDAVSKLLPSVQKKLAETLLEEAFNKFFELRNLNEVDQLLKAVEALPLASLPTDHQDAYKILRAVWLRDSKHDFENAVTVLQAISEGTSKVAETAKYFLADTYYERARQLNNKSDYERAATLLKEVIDKGLFFDDELVYQHLTIANHELGQDQDTRSFLETRLQQRRDTKLASALVSLCVNYLKDFACADKNITQFENDKFAKDIRVARLELHVLRDEYMEAEKLLGSTSNQSEFGLENELTLFYRVWIFYVLQRKEDVQVAFRRWQIQMESVRRSDEPIYWVFDAANRKLEADTKLSTDQKDRLREMIRAMADKSRPLPK